MISQENIFNNLSDDIYIVNYLNLIFLKLKDSLSQTSIKTNNRRSKSMKIKDYYNIDKI